MVQAIKIQEKTATTAELLQDIENLLRTFGLKTLADAAAHARAHLPLAQEEIRKAEEHKAARLAMLARFAPGKVYADESGDRRFLVLPSFCDEPYAAPPLALWFPELVIDHLPVLPERWTEMAIAPSSWPTCLLSEIGLMRADTPMNTDRSLRAVILAALALSAIRAGATNTSSTDVREDRP